MSQLVDQPVDPTLASRAQAALRRHAWGEAFELLSEADRRDALDAEALLLLADAAWWTGKLPKAIDALERAYAAALKAGRPDQAAEAAIILGRNHVLRSQHAIATAWLRRAERLLADVPEGYGHGWLAVTRAFEAGQAGPVETILAQADLAESIASRVGDRDLSAMALVCRGMGLVMAGKPADGLALLDEAAVAAVGGELKPDTAGSVCCAAIGACTALGDVGRATQLTEAQDRWCEREHISGYPGMCRLYRSEIKLLRGSWLEAEAEARRAAEELVGFIPAAAGLALYMVGELRLRRGDLVAAEEALIAAHERGQAEPALSLLRLAQGRADAALEGIRRALDGTDQPPSWQATPNSPIARAGLLPAMVEIAVAAGDLAAADGAAEELADLAGRVDAPIIRARAATARAAVQIAHGDAAGAVASARRAAALWRDLDAPWDAARSRVLLGEALAADGATDPAALELQAARAVFERLDAVLDLRRVDALLAKLGRDVAPTIAAGGPERVLRTFVFTDIVDSTKLAAAVGDEAWDRALRWHDRTLRAVTAEHGGEEVKRTGDGFFLAFDDADRAIEWALTVQRRLAEPPPDLGVAIAIRIGMHQAEANRSGLDYVGGGVNIAARITREAGGAEILVSHATLDGTRRQFAVSGVGRVTLRGVPEPVEVAAVDWRADGSSTASAAAVRGGEVSESPS
jgi:class 3 adenylate cyclase/tetratricopeptide (TPR) repeat protein